MERVSAAHVANGNPLQGTMIQAREWSWKQNLCLYAGRGLWTMSQVCTWSEMLCDSLGPRRCQDATSRISIKFNVREGQSGELQVRVETGRGGR